MTRFLSWLSSPETPGEIDPYLALVKPRASSAMIRAVLIRADACQEQAGSADAITASGESPVCRRVWGLMHGLLVLHITTQ